jgi:UDP-N-acetylmuramoylalanine--D-glutamate ligase
VEVSSFQLHWTETVEFRAAAVLNIAADHLDWHGSLEAYAADKALIWRGGAVAVVNADDPAVLDLAAARGAGQVVGFTLGEPSPGQVGVRDGTLLELGRGPANNAATAVVLAEVAEVRPPGPHNVANALAAAALARSLDHAGVRVVGAGAVQAGLRAFSPGAHRIAHVVTVDGVDYVDDSKATNAHAAAASLTAFPHIVWLAGGLAKGARFDDLVEGAKHRLRGAVLIGRDRALLAEALARHAPEIPVVEVTGTDTGAMEEAVRAAAAIARPGDTVLLAPACASMDMFRDYAERGDVFAAAARRLTGVRPAP